MNTTGDERAEVGACVQHRQDHIPLPHSYPHPHTSTHIGARARTHARHTRTRAKHTQRLFPRGIVACNPDHATASVGTLSQIPAIDVHPETRPCILGQSVQPLLGGGDGTKAAWSDGARMPPPDVLRLPFGLRIERRTLWLIGLGQLISAVLCATGVLTTLLVNRGVETPCFQSFGMYLVLMVVYGSVLHHRGECSCTHESYVGG